MAQSCNPDESEPEFNELDHVSLRTRRRLLVSSDLIHPTNRVAHDASSIMSKVDVGVKKEDDCGDKLAFSAKQNGYNGVVLEFCIREISKSTEIGYGQDICESGNWNGQKSPVAGSGAEVNSIQLGKTDGSVSVLTQNQTFHVANKVNIELLDGNLSSLPGGSTNHFAHNDLLAFKTEAWTPADIVSNDLDHVVLKERRRMLLTSIPSKLAKSAFEANSKWLSESQAAGSAERIKEELLCINGESSVAGSQYGGTSGENDSTLGENLRNGSSNGTVTELRVMAYEHPPVAKRAKKSIIDMEKSRQNYFPVLKKCMQSSSLQNSIKVKVEPFDGPVSQNLDKNGFCNLSVDLVQVKRVVGNPKETNEDELDHMKLSDRMNLPTSDLNLLNCEFSGRIPYAASEFGPKMSEYVKPVRVHRPWKRKKTATDSIETALEEDAPGLLKVLLGQGISINEMKLYGETGGDDDPLDESFSEESFSELEAVISKLFPQRDSFMKFPQVRCGKVSKPSYCLACLFSLVEQARYLQFRKWPVEWGWCRDLQSFLFVFKRHKRIVMERPEYGYATYFFEMVDTSPIGWQIKRLVTAMKLTSCGRVALIENKPLLIGEDLTEGEAQVLMGYGWLPNTGLGTMLNYCDRVVHDRKHGKDTLEWRSKIGKLLVDGYNDGVIVSTAIANDDKGGQEFTDTDNAPVKLEMI